MASKRGADPAKDLRLDDESLDRDIPKWHEFQQHAAQSASRSSSPLTLTAALSPASSPLGEYRRLNAPVHRTPVDLDRVVWWTSKLSPQAAQRHQMNLTAGKDTGEELGLVRRVTPHAHGAQSRLGHTAAHARPHHFPSFAVGKGSPPPIADPVAALSEEAPPTLQDES